MSTVLQLIEVKVCSIGIGHQRALEVTKKLLDNLFLTTAIQIIADLGGQVDKIVDLDIRIFSLTMRYISRPLIVLAMHLTPAGLQFSCKLVNLLLQIGNLTVRLCL